MRTVSVATAFFQLFASISDAAAAGRTFTPSKVGRALHESGWTVVYSLGLLGTADTARLLAIAIRPR